MLAARRLCALTLFLSVVAAVTVSARSVGIAWAENDYLDHVDAIARWIGEVRTLGASEATTKLSREYWEDNRYLNPHPPLFKYEALLARTLLPGLPWPSAERLPTAIAFAGAAAALFVTLARRCGTAAGLVGALALVTMPRLFGHAAFCTPDVPVAVAWLCAALAWERWDDTRRAAWLWLVAAIFAGGMATKLTSALMLAPLAGLTLASRARGGFSDFASGMAAVATIAVAGVVALLVLYPFLWPDPVARLGTLLGEAAGWSSTNPFSTLFFGHVGPSSELPWYFGSTMVALTAPPLTLALAAWGIVGSRVRDPLWRVGVVMVAFWLVLVAMPTTPKYDNERQMLPLFPFLALLAGIGWGDIVSRIGDRMPLVAAATSAIVAVLVAGLVRAHPFPLRYFSPVVGGPKGAVALGFEPTYLMEVLSPRVLDELQAHIPEGAGVTVLPGTAVGRFLRRRGWLRNDLRLNNDAGPFWILVSRHNVLHGYPGVPVRAYGSLLWSYTLDDVSLVELRYAVPR